MVITSQFAVFIIQLDVWCRECDKFHIILAPKSWLLFLPALLGWYGGSGEGLDLERRNHVSGCQHEIHSLYLSCATIYLHHKLDIGTVFADELAN